MKKTFFSASAATLGIAVLTFWACQKSAVNHFGYSEKNIQIVPLDSARQIAVHFNPSVFFYENNSSNNPPFRSSLNGNNVIKDYATINDSKGVPAMYVFNFENNKGFLFVSADYQLSPLLGYVERGYYKKDTVPPGIIQWGIKTIDNIEIVRSGHYNNSKEAKLAWKNFYNQNDQHAMQADRNTMAIDQPPSWANDPCQLDPSHAFWSSKTVGPLLPITWGQDYSYNDQCPVMNCTGSWNTNAVTGCVATAMALIIKYWQPTNKFSYNYASMPTTQGNSEVQRLMHDAGTYVGMSYGCATSGGSSADGSKVPLALVNFGFSVASRTSYDPTRCQTILANIDNHWPVLLEGCNDERNRFLGILYSPETCHEWVCDGYQQSTVSYCPNSGIKGGTYLYYHMNWGWHEIWHNNDYNGWFAYADWPIHEDDGSILNFQYAQDMVTGIHP